MLVAAEVRFAAPQTKSLAQFHKELLQLWIMAASRSRSRKPEPEGMPRNSSTYGSLIKSSGEADQRLCGFWASSITALSFLDERIARNRRIDLPLQARELQFCATLRHIVVRHSHFPL
jgi:hypothetical protein